MHPFATYVLQAYHRATGWNDDNLYANLTRSSTAILDFNVPKGIHFNISKAPNPVFKTTYSMTAMPSLRGSLGYIFTSCDLDIKSSRDARFKDTIEHFRVYDQPRKAEPKEEVWLAGERVDTRDYLLYGRFYLPTGRLDALYSTRFNPTTQVVVAAISDPPSTVSSEMRRHTSAASNLMVNLQHDVGKWCSEMTWSAEDSMWGVRILRNFGKFGVTNEDDTSHPNPPAGIKRIDEEDAVEGGLKGRVSMGAELYFSAKEKSAGVSTGIRFTTLPDTPPLSSKGLQPHQTRPLAQAPTTMTALFNPMLGHISTAYTAEVSKDLTVSSRFDFNVYSFDSEWTMGTEWWLRRQPRPIAHESSESEPATVNATLPDVNGVIKARASTSKSISLMWEGRLRNMLVSLGVVSDLSSRTKPIKALGLEVSYFSSE